MRVVVTGASGRLGGAVCRMLADNQVDVHGVDVNYRADLPAPMTVADLTRYEQVYRVLEGADAVVHLANHPNADTRHPVQALYTENCAMNVNVFQAAIELGVRRIVFASSIQVICGDRTGNDLDRPSVLPYLPLDGDLPAHPGNLYAASKQAGETLLRSLTWRYRDLAGTAIRFPYLGLPRSRWRSFPIPGSRSMVDEGMTFLPFEDAAALVLAVLRRAGPGYHQWLPAASTPMIDNHSLSEIIELCYPNVPIRGDAPLTSLVDTSAITAAVGWEPTPQPCVADPAH